MKVIILYLADAPRARHVRANWQLGAGYWEELRRKTKSRARERAVSGGQHQAVSQGEGREGNAYRNVNETCGQGHGETQAGLPSL